MRRRYCQFLAAAAIAALLLTSTVLKGQQSPRQLYERAKIVEEANDPKQAIRLYEQAIAQSKDRTLSAEAHLRIAGCYEKLGSAEARKVLEEILSKYEEQTAIVLQARQHLDALAARAASPKGTLTDRLLWTVDEVRLLSVTPDGRWMTSGTRTDGAIRLASTGEIQRVIDGADAPLISPDGKTIVYNFHGTDSLRPKGDDEPGQLRMMSVESGSKPRVLVSTPDIRYCIPVAWAPDGKAVLLEITKPDRTWQIGWVSVADGETNKIKQLRSLDWRLVGLTTQHASLSPDGRYIAYSALTRNPKTGNREDSDRDSDAQDIYIMSADGATEKVLAKTGGINEAPVWTPDGTHILFISDRSGTFDLYSVAVKAGEATGFPTQVKKGVGRIIPINTMSQSGTLYYVSKPESEVQIAEMDPAALKFRGFGASGSETFPGLRPSWSPDGQSIAFSKLRADGQTADVVVLSLKTRSSKVYLTGDHDPITNGQVVQWFPEGKSLLKGNCGACIASLYRIELNGGNITEVAGSSGFVTGIAAISGDEKTVYLRVLQPVEPDKPRMARIAALQLEAAPSDPLQLTITPDFRAIRQQVRTAPSSDSKGYGYATPDGVSDFVLSPDGHTLALTSSPDPKSGEVYLATTGAADGQDYRKLYGPFRSDRFGHKLSWTKDGRTILFAISDANDRWKIMHIPAVGGKAEFTGLEVARLRNFDLSPDGSRIAFEVAADPNWQVRAFDYISSTRNSGR